MTNSEERLNSKDWLLVICNRFPHASDTMSGIFVKEQVIALSKYFRKITVVSLTPFVPDTPLTRIMIARRKRDAGATNYSFDNVEVLFPRPKIVPPFLSKGRAATKISKWIKKEIIHERNPDIVHAHFTWPSGYVAMILKEEWYINYILTAHGYDVYELPFNNKYYNEKIKKILQNANHIITVSQENKKILVNQLGVPTEKINIIPNGYNPISFHPMNRSAIRKKLSIPIDKKIILSVGNLNHIKGHEYLVIAAKNVIKENKEVLFYLIGEGIEKKNLEKRIEELGLKDYFFITGLKPHEEIPYWMGASDLFVLPSLNEGLPTVLLEALGTGIPVVGTTVGGVPEIINDERVGILVPPADSDSLSSALLDALNKKWDNTYIVNSVNNNSWQKISQEIFSLYNNSERGIFR